MADSGALIGLSRSDLEQSLETLEMMAGEIGASVIVVKEIEVPPAMVAFADKVSAYIDPKTGKWTEKMSNKRFRTNYRRERTSAGTETDADMTDTDDDPSTLGTPNFPPDGTREAAQVSFTHYLSSANPDRPSPQSSPFIAPLDDDLALFCMDPEPEFADDSDSDDKDTKEDQGVAFIADSDVPDFSLDIEISSVFKPRPFRRRVDHAGAGVFGGKQGRKVQKPKDRKPWKPPSPPIAVSLPSPDSLVPSKQEDKALLRRQTRDKRREERRLVHASANIVIGGAAVAKDDTALPVKDLRCDRTGLEHDATDLAVGLRNLHVSAGPAKVVVDEAPSPAIHAAAVEINSANDPRLIVEALVVRKMSMEEGFLDLAGFSLA